MIASQQEIFSVLREYNPWWSSATVPDLPGWHRAVFPELISWVIEPPTKRAVLLSGARQVGKTTLLRQTVEHLLAKGVDPQQILYVTFDNPLLKLVGLEKVIRIWEELRVRPGDTEYLLLDEIQYTADWQTWVKHQVDFNKSRRIVVTGSAMPVNAENPESGVGRWHTIKLPTLSFYEYLKIKDVSFKELPDVRSLLQLFSWSDTQRIRTTASARPLLPHFNEYLLRGGFPETALVANISIAQKLLREDIVDKVLKRDMTALYGVRHVLDLEKVFLYLCLHDGGILDIKKIGENLQMSRQKVNNFLSLLEAAHLLYILHPFGYGKQVLKGKHKVYLADAAIAGSVLLKGEAILEDATRLGAVVETAFFKHVFTRYYPVSVGFSYWRDSQTQFEVDVIAEIGDRIIPFEVKYESRIKTSHLRGLDSFCEQRSIQHAYLVTRSLSDFSVHKAPKSGANVLNIPAVLACYWLSRAEHGE